MKHIPAILLSTVFGITVVMTAGADESTTTPKDACVIDGCKYILHTHNSYGDYWRLEETLDGLPRELSIPSHIKGIPVTQISEKAFDDSQAVQKINIPKTIRPYGAFYRLSKTLNEVVCEGYASFAWHEFSDCPVLTNVIIRGEEFAVTNILTFPKGCYTNIYTTYGGIGKECFVNCTNLTSIVLPTKFGIKEGAFVNCPLESVTYPDGSVYDNDPCESFCGYPYEDFRVPALTSISEARLRNGKAKPGEMVFVDGVKYEFSKSGLYVEAVDPTKSGPFAIPSSIEGHKVSGIRTFNRYGNHKRNSVFQGCSGITSLEIPDGLSLSVDKIWGLSSLGELILGRNVEVFGHDDLGIRSGTLTNVVIKGGGGKISAGGFVRCGNLRSIVLPREPMKIAKEGFRWCAALESVTYPDGEICLEYPTECFSGPVVQTMEKAIQDKKQAVLDNTIADAAEKTANIGWESIPMPDGGVAIDRPKQAVSGDIAIPATIGNTAVKAIGSYAFENSTELTMVSIPEGVTTIGEYAFRGCSSLKEVIIPYSVTNIGTAAFHGCKKLQSVIYPDGKKYSKFYTCFEGDVAYSVRMEGMSGNEKVEFAVKLLSAVAPIIEQEQAEQQRREAIRMAEEQRQREHQELVNAIRANTAAQQQAAAAAAAAAGNGSSNSDEPWYTCRHCGGSGQGRSGRCKYCNGLGKVRGWYQPYQPDLE